VLLSGRLMRGVSSAARRKDVIRSPARTNW
jgi:hypothetical protein